MADIEKIKQEIERLRNRLNKLVVSKNDLRDKEILEVSRKLDLLINKYNDLIK